MRAMHVAVKSWEKPCARCGKPTFEDLLDENGRCAYCREIVSMKTRRRTDKVSRER
jgi:DNA-directed RNA polymerase subunit RPC12/RpoP